MRVDQKESAQSRLWFAFASFLALIGFIVWNDRNQLPENGVSSIRNRQSKVKRITKQSPRADIKDAHITRGLQAISSRYYIYEDETISQARRIKHFRKKTELEVEFDHVRTDIASERIMLEALEHHPLRTRNPQEAEIFIVPTPITELLAYGCHWENCTWYDEAFDALEKNPIFKEHQGHDHVLIAQSWPVFNKKYSAYMPALSRNYRRIENITVANDFDPYGCMKLNSKLTKESSYHHDDFETLFEEETPVTNAFSVGLGFHRPFPVQLASFEKFKASEIFVFYHPGEGGLSYGSSEFRDAILAQAESITEALPTSSLGHHIPRKDWLAGITSSNFCLVIREHAPHSYSLANAVRAGCIPVIVSDDYQDYAGPFKSSMSTKDFAFYIEEAKLLANPLAELFELRSIPEAYIHEKVEHLAFAQKLLLPDHPESLFVEAFVKETIAARTNVLPQVTERVPVQVLQGDVTLSGQCIQYHYPSTLTVRRTTEGNDEPVVIVGVLSEPENFDARHSIRETWASNHEHRVYFVVAGQWDSSIKEEFETFGDILWVGMQEDYGQATFKVQAFLHAIDEHVDNYDYVMKTDDDSYVFLDDVKRHLGENKPDYWGLCHKEDAELDHDATERKWHSNSTAGRAKSKAHFFASGIGYAMSHKFVRCGVQKHEAVKDIRHEDAATGVLAELCGVTCSSNGWTSPWDDRSFVYHGLTSSAEMVQRHWTALKNHKLAEWSL